MQTIKYVSGKSVWKQITKSQNQKIMAEGKLLTDLMSDPPALDAVLGFLSCSCTCACVNPTCVYIVNGRRCSDMCRLGTREENDNDSEEEQDSEEESDTDWLYFCD